MEVANKNKNFEPSKDKVNSETDSSLAFTFALCSDLSSSAESVMEYLSPNTKAYHAANIMEGLRGLVIGNSEANIMLNKILEQRLRNISKIGASLLATSISSEVKTSSDKSPILTSDPGSLEGVNGPSRDATVNDEDVSGYAI